MPHDYDSRGTPDPRTLKAPPMKPTKNSAPSGGHGESGKSGDSAPDAPLSPVSPSPGTRPSAGGAASPFSPVSDPAPSENAANRASASDLGDLANHIYTPAPRTNPVVGALKRDGLYLRVTEGGHVITCLKSAEHPQGSSAEAVYLEPTTSHPYGRYVCGHTHAEKVAIEDLLDHLGVTPAEARVKPRIRLIRGETHLAVAAAARELAKGPYFRSNGSIVRVDEDPDGRVALQRLNEPSLSPILASSIHWERKLKEGWVQDDPPRQVMQQLLCHNTPHILRLEGVARQPFLRPDGSLVSRPGYDPETCTYGVFRETYNFGIPSEDTARSALAELCALIEGFPTASEADKSAALCLLLTAAIRPSLPQAPAFNITAPLIGSGKSHLAKLGALFATPDEPYAVSYPTTADEATKQMPSMLCEKPPVILFDDMQTNWLPHGVINRVLTNPTITERVLGEGRMSTVRTNSLFIGTGNDIEPAGDMRRRVVSIRLEPEEDAPALRSFPSDPVAAVRRNRARAVRAALEIIRGYQAAGSPKAGVPSIGSYEQWSTWCRQPLLWLGLADPATSLIKQVNHDHDRQARQHFLTLLHDEFGSHPLLVKEIIEFAVRKREVMEVLDELSMVDRRGVNAKSLGWYLKLKCARPVGGLTVEPVDAAQWRTAWKVVRSGGAPARARAGAEWPDETSETGGRPFRPLSDRDDHVPKRRPKKAVAGW